MKIKGTCRRCDREFLAEQVIASGGVCPWDGEPFSADYAATLVSALGEAEEAGNRLERSLRALAGLRPDLTLDTLSVVGGLQENLERLSKNLVKQG